MSRRETMNAEQVSALFRLYEKHGHVDRCRTCGQRNRVVYSILDMTGECLNCRLAQLAKDEEAEKEAEETRKRTELFLKDFDAL
jgi:hypothetical protein